MSVLIMWASPNEGGLTAKCKEAAKNGINSAGKEVVTIHLNEKNIKRCKVCSTGYGICNVEHSCCIEDDDFEEIQRLHKDADAIIVISPVYYGEMSEPAKAFYDRLRRCDAKSEVLKGKNCVLIAAAGGSGNGSVECLSQMDKYMKNLGMNVCDRIPVIRFNSEYIMDTVQKSAAKLAENQ